MEDLLLEQLEQFFGLIVDIDVGSGQLRLKDVGRIFDDLVVVVADFFHFSLSEFAITFLERTMDLSTEEDSNPCNQVKHCLEIDPSGGLAGRRMQCFESAV